MPSSDLKPQNTATRFFVLALMIAATVVGIVTAPREKSVSGGGLDLKITGAIQHFRRLEHPKIPPKATFVDDQGAQKTLKDMRGKVVLVNFWATWCAPCVREMPALDALQKRLGGQHFDVLAISSDRAGALAIRQFYKKTGVSALKIYLDPGARMQRKFGANSLPTSVLIDRSGRMVGHVVGPAEWAAPESIALIRYFMAR